MIDISDNRKFYLKIKKMMLLCRFCMVKVQNLMGLLWAILVGLLQRNFLA